MRVVLPLVVLLALVTACAAQPHSAGSSPSASGSSPAADPDNDLLIQLDQGDGSTVQRWTLTCGSPAGGTHPDPQAACDHLAGMAHPFAPIPADMMCSQVYGGPQRAHVTGRWRGEAVDLRLSRVDGCRVSQWNDLGPVLPGRVGSAPPS